MQCLNIKNKEVAALLEEYTNILGSKNAAYYVLSENNGYGLDKAPNGEPSKLFSDLLEHYNGDRATAIQAKAKTYSESFRSFAKSNKLDTNNEYKLSDIINNISGFEIYSPSDITNLILDNSKIEEIKNSSAIKAIVKQHEQLVNSVKHRINTTSHAKFKDPNTLDKLNRLLFQLNKLENDKSIYEFVRYMAEDINDAFKLLQNYINQYEDFEKGLLEVNPVSPAKLDLIRKGVIGFYNNMSINILNMLDDPEAAKQFSSLGIYDEMKYILENVSNRYSELARKYNQLSDKIAKKSIVSEAAKHGSYTLDQLQEILQEGDTDLSWWDRWIGQTQYNSNEIIRIGLNKMMDAKYRVADKERIVGKELLDLLSKVSKSDLPLLYERSKDGKRTGNFIRDLNFGQHEQDYMDHMLKVVTDMDITIPQNINFSDIPSLLNPEQLKRWNKSKNDWDAIYSDRKFIPEYYDITNSLSEEARDRRDSINEDITNILKKTIDKNGKPHREDLSQEEYQQLVMLENRRKNLSNIFYPNGEIKTGLDKQIAIEMKEYNKKLENKLNYKPNMERFNAAKKEAKKTLSPEKYKLWEERNTLDKISEQFYEDIAKLSSVRVKSEDQLSYESARSQLIRLYTIDGKTDIKNIPDNVKVMINTYDELIAMEAMKNREQGVKSRVMEIAEWEVNPKFYIEMDKAWKGSQAEWNVWVSQNGRYDRNGNIVPASFWKKLVPKKELRDKYIEKVPNSSWVEIDKESPFYNTPKYDKDGKLISGFDESLGVYRIPKRKYYDNTANFNKVAKNKNLKDLYDKLNEVMQLSNTFLPFLRYVNNGRLPQIEGGALTQILSQDNILKGLGYAIQDIYTIKDDDTQYNQASRALEPDGSPVRLIPTRYLKKLSNPEALTNDIVGSVIAYYKMAVNFDEMSKIAPDMEIITDFISRQTIRGNKGEVKASTNSRTFNKMREMVDQFVYGMTEKEASIEIPIGSNKKINMDLGKVTGNIARLTRLQGMANNLNVILTGLFTNKIQSRLDAISGIYYDNEALAKATKEVASSYASALANIGNPNNKNKALCFLEWSGSVRTSEETFSKLNQSRWLRALNQHFFFGGYEMADYTTKGKMALAIAMNYKFDPSTNKFITKNDFLARYSKDKKKGKAEWSRLTTTLYDAFEMKGNQIVIRDEYKNYLDELTLNRVRNTIKQVGTRIDTQFSDLDKNFITSNFFCKMLLIYRNFLPINIQTKFITKRQFDYSTGLWQEAQFRGAANYIWRHYVDKNKINTLREMYRNYDTLDEFERACLKRTTYEVLFCTIGLYLLSAFFKSEADDDKDSWWKQMTALLSTRTAIESRSNLLPVEAINMFTSPTAAWSVIEAYGNVTEAMFTDPTQEIVRGPYKGNTKLYRSLIKTTPFRSIYELKDPRSKLEYYDNLISIF